MFSKVNGPLPLGPRRGCLVSVPTFGCFMSDPTVGGVGFDIITTLRHGVIFCARFSFLDLYRLRTRFGEGHGAVVSLWVRRFCIEEVVCIS